MHRLVPCVLLVFAACAHPLVSEPSNEDRLTRTLAEPAGPIPEPLPFVAQAPLPKVTRGIPVDERPFDDRSYRSRWGWYPWDFPLASPSQGLPQIRSNALTHPQGMPGGSRPGLLP